jgi:hypothetical protein
VTVLLGPHNLVVDKDSFQEGKPVSRDQERVQDLRLAKSANACGGMASGIFNNSYRVLGWVAVYSCIGCVLPKATSLRRHRATKSQSKLKLAKFLSPPSGRGTFPNGQKGICDKSSVLILSTTLKGGWGPLKMCPDPLPLLPRGT